jgi:molybdate transport system substrate-binding protein
MAIAALTAGAAGCGGDDSGGGSGPARLVVSAASSMTKPLESCAPEFGAKVDAYVAANTKLPDELHGDGLLSEPVEFATNEFVLAVPKGSQIASLADLTKPGTKLAIGSESVPIGAYTRETLAKLPPEQEKAILANVRSNEPDVKGIVGKLTQGAADAGFVYVTDVNAAAGDLRAIKLPAELEPQVTYAAGVVKKAEQPSLARRFVDGLTEGPCADSLGKAGFGQAP